MSEDTIREITIDLDIDHQFFITRSATVDVIYERIKDIPHVAEVKIRSSASGRTHFRLTLSSPVSLFEHFLIRAYLGDDPYRLANDLSRYFHYRDDTAYGRLFDVKYKNGEKKTAGAWLNWEIKKGREMVNK